MQHRSEAAQKRYLARLVGQMEQADEWELAQQFRDAEAEIPDGVDRMEELNDLVRRAVLILGDAAARPRRLDWLPLPRRRNA